MPEALISVIKKEIYIAVMVKEGLMLTVFSMLVMSGLMSLPTKLRTPQVRKLMPQVLTILELATPVLKVLVLEP
ncbi:MAG: hypothetical protein COV41_02455 [Candidatus Brennerbacteria bacterium CG11_big_fil_rev_8_21_14_0_20_43_10]|uniref:Uncharacterized protein n=1 Tax=Candidatus Brennerbacteria bacterium CG11_big_fil_rev_8_21_14_0_20_43_10 TaxID=1974523 RepID=A0A2H0PV48_9BACT|nr:MAG: hypothetical protein COV41_02455 [Candidatus Brennerbacteria bacterium CG11_big_fil_rev_8_21_14_0_20_43_10]